VYIGISISKLISRKICRMVSAAGSFRGSGSPSLKIDAPAGKGQGVGGEECSKRSKTLGVRLSGTTSRSSVACISYRLWCLIPLSPYEVLKRFCKYSLEANQRVADAE
jgi:hypothetical protein